MNVRDFFAENNVCGQNVLQLVSRGNAVIAELLRLKDYVPSIFRLENKQEVQKYGEIILDFSYFKVADAHEHKIENNDALRELDEEFRDNHLEIINRFYSVFESIHVYISDLKHFLDELDDGIYIHQSLETIFADVEGRQVMCESLYLYGVMLLVVDAHIDGIIRERLLVSYYRYTPQRNDTQSHIDEVCKLLRDTGHNSPKGGPINYPEDYFRRVLVAPTFVDVVIGRLRSDDIYNQLSVYPLSKHRSTALTTQASMLYVCLYFSPNILHNQTAVMREIVDKYFPDNWVISLYMGFVVNVVEAWEPFKAARMALSNTVELINIKSYASFYALSVGQLHKSSSQLLKEGNLTKESVINDINNITSVLRDCNVTIRWLMLHTVSRVGGKAEKNKKCKQLREIVLTETKYSPAHIFKLLLNTAQLELITKDIIRNLLDDKDDMWNELKKESYLSLMELSEVFGGIKPLTRIEKNVNLQRWFAEISKQVDSLDQNDGNSGRKIVHLIQALVEVQEFHQLDKNMQVVQFLTETRKFLDSMIKNMNVKEDTLITLQIIGDVSYAWELIDTYTAIMQLGIKKEPTLCIKLRAIFLKLASALEIPLLRINQARSEDLLSVSEYYSGELEIYARRVLQIIPKMMFENMARIIEMQTSVLKELPTRLEKEKLREYAQLNERFEFAELTHSISVYSEGMRMMKTTLVGVICLDAKKLLEDGIRKELVQHISKTLHNELIFSARPKADELEQRLVSLARVMDGYKRSLEYIQDYVNINGLKIWQEEVTRIVNYNVEQECNGFLRNKVYDWESAYQNRYVPIPRYPSVDSISENFIGRLAREIIRLTDPKNTIYLEQTSTWYDAKTHKALLNKEAFALVASAIEITGLVGLDRLFSYMIISSLQKIMKILENKENKTNAWTNILSSISSEMDFENMASVGKFYQNCVNRTSKLWSNILDLTLSVGQLQLLRVLATFQLNMRCKFDAKHLESSLSLVNKALLSDIQKGDEAVQASEDIFVALSPYFDWAGMNNPLHKIYLTCKPQETFASTLFIFAVTHLHKLFLLTSATNLSKRNVDQIDGVAFIVAIHTIFKQFHPNLNESFLKLFSTFLTEFTKQSINLKNAEVPNDVTLGVRFLEVYGTLLKTANISLLKHIPEELLYLHDLLSITS